MYFAPMPSMGNTGSWAFMAHQASMMFIGSYLSEHKIG
jgi:hypothetical protein